MTEIKRGGMRRIELFCPFDAGCGRTIDAVVLRPATLDHTLRWQQGRIAGPMALLAELSGLGQDVLGQMTYPDADIVLAEFAMHLPPAIRQSIASFAPAEQVPEAAPEEIPEPEEDGIAGPDEILARALDAAE